MTLASLIATGTKVWLDGVGPDEIQTNYARGVTGATSNPTIVSKIIGRGHFDGRIEELIRQGLTDDQIAWALDDELVCPGPPARVRLGVDPRRRANIHRHRGRPAGAAGRKRFCPSA